MLSPLVMKKQCVTGQVMVLYSCNTSKQLVYMIVSRKYEMQTWQLIPYSNFPVDVTLMDTLSRDEGGIDCNAVMEVCETLMARVEL